MYLDEPFEQEISEPLGTLADVRDLALSPTAIPHVVTADGVLRLQSGGWQSLGLDPGRSSQALAFDTGGALAAVGPDGASIDGAAVDAPGGAALVFVGPRMAGGFWLAGDQAAGWWDGSYHDVSSAIGAPVRALIDGPDGWLAATAVGVVSEGETATTADGLPSDDVRSLARAADGTVWAGTAAGLASRDPQTGAWTAMTGADGLHYEDVTRVAVDDDGVVLVSTPMGASRYHPDGQRRYYFGRAWLVSDEVRAVARSADGSLLVATAAGVSRLSSSSMTLEQKAALFDGLTQERHVRLGYTSTENHLDVYGDVDSWGVHDDDNDGQWTAMYLASQCFRYAVTGSEEARTNATVAADAMLRLETVTGLPGFFARSVVEPELCPDKQTGAGEWHLSEDGTWCWKGDTSSDEFVGHVFGLSLYHDLVADSEEQKRVASTFGDLIAGIVDNGLMLVDVDGLATTHGRFDPEWINHSLDAVFGDAGLNSAMILGGLQAAYRMTGDARFRTTFDQLAHGDGYAEHISRIEEINLAYHTNHDSEEMSFLAMYALARYEDDPALLAKWQHGLDYLWEVQRPERNPEFNFVFAPLARVDEYDLAISIETLHETPLDLILWGLDLQHRADGELSDDLDRFDKPQNAFVFPYDERQPQRWAENPYAYEQRGGGQSELSGTFWLLPYWMARYHGLIR